MPPDLLRGDDVALVARYVAEVAARPETVEDEDEDEPTQTQTQPDTGVAEPDG